MTDYGKKQLCAIKSGAIKQWFEHFKMSIYVYMYSQSLFKLKTVEKSHYFSVIFLKINFFIILTAIISKELKDSKCIDNKVQNGCQLR